MAECPRSTNGRERGIALDEKIQRGEGGAKRIEINNMSAIEFPVEKKICKDIKEKFGKKFESAETAFRLAQTLINIELPFEPKENGMLSHCLIAVYVKQIRLFYVIYRLCEGGLGEEANLQLRAMLEIYAKLLFLFNSKLVIDKEKFSRNWYVWYVANVQNFFESGKTNGYEYSGQCWEWVYPYLEKMKEQENIPDKDWKNFVFKGPWNLSFNELCKAVGLEKEYPIYSLLSGATHGYDLFRHAKRIDQKIELNLEPSDMWIDQSLLTAVSLLYDSLKLINEGVGLGKELIVEHIGKCRNDLKSIIDQNP